jgi:hypothetical protein
MESADTSRRLLETARRRAARTLAALLLAAAAAAGAQAPPSRADADAMRLKLDRVAAAAADAHRPAAAPRLRTTFTEREINAWLSFEGPAVLPPGIATPRLQLGDDGRVRARAVVHLDGVRRARERSAFDPLAYVTGAVEVVATGRIEARDGQGLIRFESAAIGGVSVPKTVAQELLRFYTRTPERPRGFAFDEPFALPAGIRAVSAARGAATVTQ